MKFPMLIACRSLLTALFLLSAFATTASAQVNYDTAWTFVYDGGKYKDGRPVYDDFRDVKVLTNGVCVWVHPETRQTRLKLYL